MRSRSGMRSASLPHLLWLLLLACLPALAQQVAVPPLTARVTDLTGTFTQAQRDALERRLAEFETRKGSQLAVLVLPTTQPETIEQYAIRVAEQWKLGHKGVDDGALLVVAMDDRALRIEVGYGLEGSLSDLVANRIVEDIMVPHFKRADFVGGIEAGVGAMIRVVDGEPLPAPAPGPAPGRGEGSKLEMLLMIGFVLVFVVGGILRAMIGRVPAALAIGGVTGFIAWTLLASLGLAAVVAAASFLFTLFAGAVRHAGRASRGGWGPPGGFGGGGFGGGLGGGGGWSGGGGGFGGGGASGRW